jgi:shikimate 5-dehydrogenase
VGKAVALILKQLGVKATAATFDRTEFESAALYADRAYFEYSFVDNLGNYDIIVNTVPAKILNGVTDKLNPSAAIIELASTPCLDAVINGVGNYIPAPGLPAKYSADAAAELMYDCIVRTRA